MKTSTKPVVLVGLMGAGKSALGRALAARLGRQFIDIDAEIEKRAGCSIATIFDVEGEARFRRMEEETLATFIEMQQSVIATGGGAVISATTRRRLKEKAVTLWLRAEVDTLYLRVSRDKGRPLLQKENPRAVLAELLFQRSPFYGEADIEISTDKGNIDESVAAALKALQAFGIEPSSPATESA